jgi:hypothetical protein
MYDGPSCKGGIIYDGPSREMREFAGEVSSPSTGEAGRG